MDKMLNYDLIMFFATKFLLGNKKLLFPASLGVGIAVCCAVVMLSLVRGFEEELISSLTRTGPHISVRLAHDNPLVNYEEHSKILASLREIKTAIPVLLTQALAQKNETMAGLELIGVPPETEGILDIVPGLKGHWLNSGFSIVLGSGLAQALNAKIGDIISISSLDDKEDFLIVGTFKSGAFEVDSQCAFIPMEINQLLYDQDGLAGEIWLRLFEPQQAQLIKEKIEKGQKYTAQSWNDRQSLVAGVMKLERRVITVFFLLMASVAAMGVMTTASMFIMARMRDFGTLLAMGSYPKEIGGALLFLTGLYSTIGSLAGLGLSWFIVKFLTFYKPGIPEEFFNISFLPVSPNPGDFVLIPILGILCAMLATLLPARKLFIINPASILRGE